MNRCQGRKAGRSVPSNRLFPMVTMTNDSQNSSTLNSCNFAVPWRIELNVFALESWRVPLFNSIFFIGKSWGLKKSSVVPKLSVRTKPCSYKPSFTVPLQWSVPPTGSWLSRASPCSGSPCARLFHAFHLQQWRPWRLGLLKQALRSSCQQADEFHRIQSEWKRARPPLL